MILSPDEARPLQTIQDDELFDVISEIVVRDFNDEAEGYCHTVHLTWDTGGPTLRTDYGGYHSIRYERQLGHDMIHRIPPVGVDPGEEGWS